MTAWMSATAKNAGKRLTLEILKEKELRKLFYYSSRFQVSEATISADLEAIEGWATQIRAPDHAQAGKRDLHFRK